MPAGSASSDRPAVAVIGAGLMGRWHAYYARRAGTRIKAVVDPDANRARALAARYPGCAAMTLDQALDLADIAHVCTPPQSQPAMTMQAFEARCDVLAEKPLAFDAAEAEALYRAAGRAGRMLCPVHQFPFQRAFGRLVERLPVAGRPVRMRAELFSAGGEGKSAAERQRLLLEILPHPLSVFARLAPGALDARWSVDRYDADVLEVHAELEGLTVDAVIDLHTRPRANRLTVHAERGTAHMDFYHGHGWMEFGPPTRGDKLIRPFAHAWGAAWSAAGNLARRAWSREPAYPGLKELIDAFHGAVGRGGEPPVSESEVVAISRIVGETRTLEARVASLR